MGKLPVDDYNCRDIDKQGLIVKMLDHQLSPEEEDALLFHIRLCPDCLAVVAEVLFARSHLENNGKDYRINVN